MNLSMIVMILFVVWMSLYVVGKMLSLTFVLFKIAGQVATLAFVIWIVLALFGKSKKK